MTQYNSLNVKLSNSQLNKLKSAKKKKKKLLTDAQVENLRKGFANKS